MNEETLNAGRLKALQRGLELARKWSMGTAAHGCCSDLARRIAEEFRIALSSQGGDYAPTPEAERRELHAMAADTGPLTVAALVSAELEAERPALVGGEDGLPYKDLTDDDLSVIVQDWDATVSMDVALCIRMAKELLTLRALNDRSPSDAALPAAQDGDRSGCPNCEGEYPDSCWYCDKERAEQSTPNAIRGDKGAEAVVEALEWLRVEISAVDPWYRGSPTYLRDGAWMKDRADDLITQAVELFAPTQATAKDTP